MAESPFLAIDLGVNGGQQTFATFEELKEWAEDECQKWNWLNPFAYPSQAAKFGYLPDYLRTGQVKARDELSSAVLNYQANNALLQQINTVFSMYYRMQTAIVSTSSAGTFILNLAKSSEEVAAWALAALTANVDRFISMNSSSMTSLEGVVQAALFKQGLSNQTRMAEKEAMDIQIQKMAKIVKSAKSSAKLANDRFSTLTQEFQKVVEDIKNSGENIINESQKTISKEIGDAGVRIAAIEKTFSDKLALQAPVAYWKLKAKGHKSSMTGLAIAILLSMPASVIIIYLEFQSFLPKIEWNKTIDLSGIGLILATLTFAIWSLRILVKIFLSRLHLFTDAKEREVFATAYLSLLKRDKALGDSDREMILQILFRPSATGIVEDAGPATPMEIGAKFFSGMK